MRPWLSSSLIGMADGHKAHAAADHLLAPNGRNIARQPDAKGDLLGQLLRQLDTFSLRPSQYDNVPLSYISYKKIIAIRPVTVILQRQPRRRDSIG